MHPCRLISSVVLLSIAGSCASDDDARGSSEADRDAIVEAFPADTWTWRPVVGTKCGFGTETGFAFNPHPGSDRLTVYFEGGGACWSGALCTATDPPIAYNLEGYDAETFATEIAGGVPPADYQVFDRSDPDNPFAEDNFVFIPYCTGDVHSGSNVATYSDASGGSITVHHVGFENIRLDLEVIQKLFPHADRLVIAGTSGGGFGATFNYSRVRAAWPDARPHLINDAAPVLAGSGAWFAAQDAAWHNFENFPADCADCTTEEGGPNRIFAYYAQQSDFRAALLSTNRDRWTSTYYSLPPGSQNNTGCQTDGTCEFEEGLREWITGSLSSAKPGRIRAFVPEANTHGFLPARLDMSAAGVPLKEFLAAQLSDDPAWADAIEPSW
jgi:hypothetical protein